MTILTQVGEGLTISIHNKVLGHALFWTTEEQLWRILQDLACTPGQDEIEDKKHAGENPENEESV